MKTQFICLANSYKEGGRCIAGIEIVNNEVIFKNSKPKWIRPVTEEGHGEIETDFVSHLKLLDIVEIDTIINLPTGYQSENVLFEPESIKVVGQFPKEKLNVFCTTNMPTIFGNKTKVVDDEKIERLNYSLALIELTEFEVVEIKYNDTPKPKMRLRFTYNSNNYDFPITDPEFLNIYKMNKNILKNAQKIIVTLSMTVIHEGLYYKLVAGIIY